MSLSKKLHKYESWKFRYEHVIEVLNQRPALYRFLTLISIDIVARL